MARKQTAQQNRDGKTRWLCPAAAGKLGCAKVDASVTVAHGKGKPVVRPSDKVTSSSAFCGSKPSVVQNPAHPVMKYQQEEYYGLGVWNVSWNRRTYVEGVFGNLKNQSTRTIKRGFTRFIGEPLITLALTAQAVDYNLKELEDWCIRSQAHLPNHQPTQDFLGHPLHTARTEHEFGFMMLTAEQQADVDRRHGAIDSPASKAA